MIIETHTVPQLPEKVRLSDYTSGIFRIVPSRKGMKKAIDKGLVRLNGRIAHTADLLSGGELLELCEDQSRTRPDIELKLKVLFEDDHLTIIHKPAGIEVSGNKKWTVANALVPSLKPSTCADKLKFPEPIHRLDYPTSGALLIGKTASAVIALNQLFANHQVQKTYFAVAIGTMSDKGQLTTEIDGKPSHTDFEVKKTVKSERFGALNLVELHPSSGRRHQLRKHLSELDNPILGDKDYGSDGLILNGKGLYLHAYSLQFQHPVTNIEILVVDDLPKKFGKLFP